jgi:hypothetical protein
MANVDVSQGYGSYAPVAGRGPPPRAFRSGDTPAHGSRRVAFRPKRGLPSFAIVRTVSRQAHVTLSGDIAGEYVVERRRPDGRR